MTIHEIARTEAQRWTREFYRPSPWPRYIGTAAWVAVVAALLCVGAWQIVDAMAGLPR